VKKIISILLALGVVLGLTMIATPVAADVTEPQVYVDNPCACETSAYNITFNLTAGLTKGVHKICVEFPEGTTVPDTYQDGDIVIWDSGIWDTDVFGSEVEVDGTTVCFLVEFGYGPWSNPLTVEFTQDAGIKNPCVDGDYTLFVSTTRVQDSTPVESAEYTIIPQYSDYGFVIDFGLTYPGIARDFVPPFKACGQNDSGQPFSTAWCATINGWFDISVFNFTTVEEGCEAPCDDVDVWFEVVECPEDEVIHLWMTDGVDVFWYTLDEDNITEDVGEYGSEDFKLLDDEPITAAFNYGWIALWHFSSPGTYEICFYAECPEVQCQPPDEYIIAERCLEFEAHQWKDAARIWIDEKWNLLSLPLVPFDSDIENMLASLPAAAMDDLVSIWNYDRCSDEWFVYDGNGYEDLEEIRDGKSYWFRMDYPIAGNYSWWVWGTEMPEPEASPAEYAVCEGWNMVGFTSLTDMLVEDYLWNWVTPFPVVYGWDQGEWNVQGWNLITAGTNLESGQGYWMAFPADGAIYVPTP
jgi:hypothetical protein